MPMSNEQAIEYVLERFQNNGIRDKQHGKQIADLISSMELNKKAMLILEHLTPGGSEFRNDPEYCAGWIKEQKELQHKLLLKQAEQIRSMEQQMQGMRNCDNCKFCCYPSDCKGCLSDTPNTYRGWEYGGQR